MQESCSYGSVGVRGGNEPLYPEQKHDEQLHNSMLSLDPRTRRSYFL